ncbi:MAG: exodeoxyribonuclease VII small subunit [Azoarcus sp.]|jgi:exodeoxyribonuclease VII small subunit|nr:exodeoxyribonuclease VII small subunit [Azoarcus sp.]
MTQPASAPQTFEAAVSELENIVRQLEAGSMPLESALEHYQRGVVLLRHCQNTLDTAEQQVKKLENDTLIRFDADAARQD